MRAKRPHAEHDADDPMRGMNLGGDDEDPLLSMGAERKAKKAKKEKKEKKEKDKKKKQVPVSQVVHLRAWPESRHLLLFPVLTCCNLVCVIDAMSSLLRVWSHRSSLQSLR